MSEEKKADEMFKKLGYEKKEVHDEITGTFLMYDKIVNKHKRRISFFKDRTIQCSESYLYVEKIDMKELQAINKKVKELGWLDERRRKERIK